jgi:hypothetical protein
MKKVISVLLTMAVFSTTVFAAPLSVAGSSDKFSGDFALIEQSSAALGGDLFADVQAAQLTDAETAKVQGEGFWFVVIAIASVLFAAQCVNPTPLY